jgi:hypothetical protein
LRRHFHQIDLAFAGDAQGFLYGYDTDLGAFLVDQTDL